MDKKVRAHICVGRHSIRGFRVVRVASDFANQAGGLRMATHGPNRGRDLVGAADVSLITRATTPYIRSTYSPESVLTLIFSPSPTKAGTITVSPVSVFAGLNELVAVAPLRFGSVSVIVSTTLAGN